MHKIGWKASDTRALSFDGLRGAGGQPARAARRGLPPVPRDPRRRPHLGRRDGRRARAGRLRPGVRVRAGATAVRQADLVVPGDPVQARRHGDRDRGRRGSSSGRPPGSRIRAAPFALEAAMAKLYTGELSNRVVNDALQIHGGYGFTDEFAISRLYRDQKILEIGEGTNEVQRMVIARHLGLCREASSSRCSPRRRAGRARAASPGTSRSLPPFVEDGVETEISFADAERARPTRRSRFALDGTTAASRSSRAAAPRAGRRRVDGVDGDVDGRPARRPCDALLPAPRHRATCAPGTSTFAAAQSYDDGARSRWQATLERAPRHGRARAAAASAGARSRPRRRHRRDRREPRRRSRLRRRPLQER